MSWRAICNTCRAVGNVGEKTRDCVIDTVQRLHPQSNSSWVIITQQKTLVLTFHTPAKKERKKQLNSTTPTTITKHSRNNPEKNEMPNGIIYNRPQKKTLHDCKYERTSRTDDNVQAGT